MYTCMTKEWYKDKCQIIVETCIVKINKKYYYLVNEGIYGQVRVNMIKNINMTKKGQYWLYYGYIYIWIDMLKNGKKNNM